MDTVFRLAVGFAFVCTLVVSAATGYLIYDWLIGQIGGQGAFLVVLFVVLLAVMWRMMYVVARSRIRHP